MYVHVHVAGLQCGASIPRVYMYIWHGATCTSHTHVRGMLSQIVTAGAISKKRWQRIQKGNGLSLGEQCETPYKQKKWMQKFKQDYSQWSVLKSSSRGVNYAFCTTCHLDFSISHGGKDVDYDLTLPPGQGTCSNPPWQNVSPPWQVVQWVGICALDRHPLSRLSSLLSKLLEFQLSLETSKYSKIILWSFQ